MLVAIERRLVVFALLLTSACTGGSAPETTAAVPDVAILSWDAPAASLIVGYKIYYGTASKNYFQIAGQGIDVGNVTTRTITGLVRGTRYYFVVTAYDAAPLESNFSNEVFKDIP